MNDKRYKNMKILMVFLVVLGIGLFLFQNVGLKFIKSETMTQYYKANKDIQPYTKLTPDLFTSVSVKEDSVPAGFITNFQKVEGSYAKGTIYKGDYLTDKKSQSANEEKDCIYTMEVTADFSGPLTYDSYIDIYTLSKDNVPSMLFTNKRLYSAGNKVLTNTDTATGTADQAVDKKYIKVTKQEMLEYYSKLKSYTFIILPIDEAYVGQKSTTTLKDVTSDKETPKKDNQTDTAKKKEAKTFTWEVKEVETWDSIASDWNTTADKLKELNPDVKDLKAGIKIEIPEKE